MTTRKTTLSFSEREVRTLLAAVRNKISDYEGGLDEASDDTDPESLQWYEDRLNELRPLELKLNRAGVRLTS